MLQKLLLILKSSFLRTRRKPGPAFDSAQGGEYLGLTENEQQVIEEKIMLENYQLNEVNEATNQESKCLVLASCSLKQLGDNLKAFAARYDGILTLTSVREIESQIVMLNDTAQYVSRAAYFCRNVGTRDFQPVAVQPTSMESVPVITAAFGAAVVIPPVNVPVIHDDETAHDRLVRLNNTYGTLGVQPKPEENKSDASTVEGVDGVS